MPTFVRDIVIVGGGTAGWLAAAQIAARGGPGVGGGLNVTVIEAPDIPTIGVGEGTWPTMRSTLASIGIDEDEFLGRCDGSFKQGSRFDGWLTGEPGDSYLHPFTPPPPAPPRAIVAAWGEGPVRSFAEAASPQLSVCARDLAPRQPNMPAYSGALNYAYHLDAGKFAELLREHAVDRLGVRHVRDRVVEVSAAEDGDIAAVRTAGNGAIRGDLFVDCSGQASLLIGDHFGVPWTDRGDILFNDRALACQVPVDAGSPIASQTIGTAHEAGWIWDIGLPSRRGIGCVYASAFATDDRAEDILRSYLSEHLSEQAAVEASIRRLAFATGHRAEFWHRNCIALGMSAGFIEPLEASAIVMIELGLSALLGDFPVDRAAMQPRANRYNELFHYRWDRIAEFLKLHYVLSRRSEPYWEAHRNRVTWPGRLPELLELWQHRPPLADDFPREREIFPAESFQYVLYGMGGAVPPPGPVPLTGIEDARRLLGQVEQRARHLASVLPTNRQYLGSAMPGASPRKLQQAQ